MCKKCFRITEKYTTQIRLVSAVFIVNETYLATIHREQKTRCADIDTPRPPECRNIFIFFCNKNKHKPNVFTALEVVVSAVTNVGILIKCCF